ncbi:hypothetical protein [Kribbella deserti]|uniref:Uncharacterized protein n=1 Tax=Kribbella deserti TaxID=1926257 RepID=A0ABV6QX43_9ACTN
MNVAGSVMPKAGLVLLASGVLAAVLSAGTATAAPANVGLAWADGGVRVTWPADSAPNLLRVTDVQGHGLRAARAGGLGGHDRASRQPVPGVP